MNKKLLINHNRRLQALKERQALYGLDTPIAILTEIENIEEEIASKTNEIPTAQTLMAALGLSGYIYTFDALHCQKNAPEC